MVSPLPLPTAERSVSECTRGARRARPHPRIRRAATPGATGRLLTGPTRADGIVDAHARSSVRAGRSGRAVVVAARSRARDLRRALDRPRRRSGDRDLLREGPRGGAGAAFGCRHAHGVRRRRTAAAGGGERRCHPDGRLRRSRTANGGPLRHDPDPENRAVHRFGAGEKRRLPRFRVRGHERQRQARHDPGAADGPARSMREQRDHQPTALDVAEESFASGHDLVVLTRTKSTFAFDLAPVLRYGLSAKRNDAGIPALACIPAGFRPDSTNHWL